MSAMKRMFTARIQREGDWFVAHCLEVDVASQGHTEEEAFENLKEALGLYFVPPRPTEELSAREFVVEAGAHKPPPCREGRRVLEAAIRFPERRPRYIRSDWR